MTRDRYDFADLMSVPDSVIATIAEAVRVGRPMLFWGPPGVGKSMVARRVPSIMRPLSDHEKRWIRIECEASLGTRPADVERPFRAPHHTVSALALAGDQRSKVDTDQSNYAKSDKSRHVAFLRAGEAQLSRFGVLLLDDLGCFDGTAIKRLATALQPMTGKPLVIATACECPCGWYGYNDPDRACRCSATSRNETVAWTRQQAARLGDFVHVHLPVDQPARSGAWSSADIRREIWRDR